MICVGCELPKEPKDYEGGRRTCRTCRNIYFKERREITKEQDKCKRLQRKYGVTLVEYNELIESKGCCEICESTTNLVYDHNHETGTFRGVLCSLCNSGLGHFKDCKTNLITAYTYLWEKGSYGKN